MAKRFDPRRILALFGADPSRFLTERGIMRLLKLTSRDRGELARLLSELVDEGQLRLIKGRRYALAQAGEEITGLLTLHRDGYGFVTPDGDEGRSRDIFLPARQLREAMNGDRVVVRVVRSQRDGRREGRLLRIEQRARQQVVGVFRDLGRTAMVIPDDPRMGQSLKIPWGKHADAGDGELVVACIATYATRGQAPLAEIVEVLGDPADPRVEVRAQARRFGLPDLFSEAVLAAADAVPPEVGPDDLDGRVDLRHLPLVTIDGADAKDFDDAVCARVEGEDQIRCWVAIADVSHYVRPGSPLDREAWSRGNSVYFPGICIPMLPEPLSNGICSLNPGVDRLVMVAEMLFEGDGVRRGQRFYPAVMHSRARLTYAQVQDGLDKRKFDPGEEVQASLFALEELARRLGRMRHERGSLDLDLPEAKVILDQEGRAEHVERSARLFAHRLIEELMLAANEAVAEHLAGRERSLLYRVHDPPEPLALEPLRQVLRGVERGEALPEKVTPKSLQRLLETFEGTPQAPIVSHVLLRCLQQARYDAENTGHFGLASGCYCHFTSPIRRYPDLVVHRALKAQLNGEDDLDGGWLERTAVQNSLSERRAMEAERDMLALKGCQVMEKHLGELFEGRVSSVAPFGVFVELDTVYVEGLLSIDSLQDDAYGFDAQRLCLIGAASGREIHLGERVRVCVAAVRCDRREIDFVPEGYRHDLEHKRAPAKRPQKPERRRGR